MLPSRPLRPVGFAAALVVLNGGHRAKRGRPPFSKLARDHGVRLYYLEVDKEGWTFEQIQSEAACACFWSSYQIGRWRP